MKHWPDIPYARWQPTGQSLHMWSQIVGKFRLATTPWVNHSWQATLYVSARGLSTSLIPGEQAAYEVHFDFIDHRLVVDATDGRRESFALEPMSVADFHRRFTAAIGKLGADVTLHHAPNEVPDPVPFAEQTDAGAYDPQAAHDFWQALLRIDAVFKHFRTGFLGKVSPVHLFWGSFDPALPDTVTREAYSHEVSSAGFWPGGGGIDEPSFYCYAYPVPVGFAEADAGAPEAYFHKDLGEFVLPYDAVRTADDPEGKLLAFLQATYEAAAQAAGWDREALECALGEPRVPRVVS